MLQLVLTKLMSFAMAAVPVGAISFALFQIVKRQSSLIDGIRNKTVKQIAVVFVAAVLTLVFSSMGLSIDCVAGENCLNLVTQDKIGEVIKWALGSFVAFALHAVKRGRK
jgi:putative copper export protein